MATEIIRVDVVEHAYDEDKAGRITKSERTSEEKKLTQEERDKKKKAAAAKGRAKKGIVYGSMALRKTIQVSASSWSFATEQSYNRQIFAAQLQGNTRRAQTLQQQKVKDKAVVNFWAMQAQASASIAAGFAINPILGAIQLAGHVIQTGMQQIQMNLEYQEEMRKYMVQMQKAIQESEYKRNRLITNTFTNRGLGR